MSASVIDLQRRLAGARPPEFLPERTRVLGVFAIGEGENRERVRVHRARPIPRREKPAALIERVMRDGRARTLEHIIAESGVRPDTVRKHLGRLVAAGDAERTKVAGWWLYCITHFGG